MKLFAKKKKGEALPAWEGPNMMLGFETDAKITYFDEREQAVFDQDVKIHLSILSSRETSSEVKAAANASLVHIIDRYSADKPSQGMLLWP